MPNLKGNRCIVCGKFEDHTIQVHRFPLNPVKCQQWIGALGLANTDANFYKARFICSHHFSQQSYTYPGSRLLNRNAVPLPFSSFPPHSPTDSGPATPSVPSTSTSSPMSSLFSSFSSCTSSSTKATPTTPLSGLSSVFRKSFREDCANNRPWQQQKLQNQLRCKKNHIAMLRKRIREKQQDLQLLLCGDIDKIAEKIFGHMPHRTKILMLAQLKAARCPPHGRRWTMEEKICSLAFFKKSPACYALLRRFLALPAPNTLNQLLSKVPFRPGINEQLFQHLGRCLATYKEEERICSLVFDEMSIREHIRYNSSLDGVDGVVDLGSQGRRGTIANHALVFMAQGVARKWKQPVAYYFTRGGICSEELVPMIREVIDSLQRAGAIVVATICDMAAGNVSTLRRMGSSVSHPYFFHGDRKVFTIFDPPHLLKCTRNLLHKYPITFPSTLGDCSVRLTANWAHIRKMYDDDKAKGAQLEVLFKLTRSHMEPVMSSAMKVSLAAQVLSRTVSALMNCRISDGGLPAEAIGTATFVLLINNLFDSLNGNVFNPDQRGLYKQVVSDDSPHLRFWDEAYKCIERWSFVGAKRPPPSQNGWLTTITAMKGVWLTVRQMGLASLRTRSLNQDPLENLFGSVRSGCGSNCNPTVQQFAGSLKIQILNNLIRERLRGTNCEEDDLELLSNLQAFFDVDEVQSAPSNEGETIHIRQENNLRIASETAESASFGNMESFSVAYVSGSIARRILAKNNCPQCYNILTSDASLPCNLYISFKELSDEQSRLTYPSEKLVAAVGHSVTLIEQILPTKLKDTGLRKQFAIILGEYVDFSWVNCTLHSTNVKKCIVEAVCCISIPWYCKRLVRNLQEQTSSRGVKRKLRILQHQ